MNTLAFDFASSPSSSRSGRGAIIAASLSERSEVAAVASDIPSNKSAFSISCGEAWSRVASPQDLARKLADFVAPGQPAKVCIPRLHHVLQKHVPALTLRRVRAIYNGEVARAWADERDALRDELTAAENAAARRAFARAAVDLHRQLALNGVPLTQAQVSALSRIVGGEVIEA